MNIKQLKRYFEESDHDAYHKFYDVRAGYEVLCNSKYDVVGLSVADDKYQHGIVTHIHDSERGQLELSEGSEFEVYRIKRKLITTIKGE